MLARDSLWTLVLMNYFTRKLDGIAILDATIQVLALILEQRVYAHLGILNTFTLTLHLLKDLC